jgi:SAM-dependent methyltransferase
LANLARVEAYFSAVAGRYQQASTHALWRRVREREARAVFALLGPIAGEEVLELGCGAGYYTRLLLERGARHVVAVDLSARMLAELPTGPVTPLCGDAATLDPGRRFGVLLSAGMLEFVPDPLAVLRNAARYAAPGAALTILAPTDTLLGRGYRRFHRRHGMEITLFDGATMARLAGSSGWRVADRRPAGPYSAATRLVLAAGR